MSKEEIKVKKENYRLTFDLCKMKYAEENYREQTINTKAGFLLTVLSILISILLNLLNFCYEINFKDKLLASWFIYIIILFLIVALMITILSQCIAKRKYLSKVMDFYATLNENPKDDVYSPMGTAIKMYNKVIEDKHKKIETSAKLLLAAFIILLIALLLALQFGTIILVR